MKNFFLKKKRTSRGAEHFLVQEGKIADSLLSSQFKNRWVEEAWLVDDEKGLNESPQEFLGVSLSAKKINLVFIFVFLVVLLIIGRLFFLQIWSGQHFWQLAEDNRLRFKPIIAERGLIYDRNQKVLVSNLPTFNLVLSPQDLPKDPEKLGDILQKVSNLSGETIASLRGKIEPWKNSSLRIINLIENIDHEKALKLIVESADLLGVSLEQSFKRFYEFNPPVFSTTSISQDPSLKQIKEGTLTPSLSHVIGYMGKLSKDDLSTHQNYLLTDYIGKSGLEKVYENKLRGLYGKRVVEVDALGKEKNIIRIDPPQPGQDLIISIDLNYQQKLEEILANNLKTQGKKRGAAIVMSPQNGEILALVNLPTYNNNLFIEGLSDQEYQKLLIDPDAPLFSRAWSGLYPSGSTIKLIVSAAALSEKIITRNTTFLSSGGIQVDRWFFPDWKVGGHGLTNVTKALAESVNTFFYLVGGGYKEMTGLGLERLVIYFKKFNLGKTLGIDLPNEVTGFVPTREWKEKTKSEQWYIGDTYNLSIGQGDLLVTPLQIAEITSIVANGGIIYRPHLAKAFVNKVTGQRQEIKPIILNKNIISDDNLKIVREGMRQAVTEGGAQSLASLQIKVAGKTGTAQWSNKAPPHAWFTSFGPWNSPKIVVTVLIEEGEEGSTSALPVAKEFYEWWSKLPNNY